MSQGKLLEYEDAPAYARNLKVGGTNKEVAESFAPECYGVGLTSLAGGDEGIPRALSKLAGESAEEPRCSANAKSEVRLNSWNRM